jgi:hypothetical protein
LNGKIYAILDPYTNDVRYIGQTINEIESRLAAHISSSKKLNRPIHKWISSLDKKPKIVCLEKNLSSIKELNSKEILYISLYKNLLNVEEGGHHKIGNRERNFKIIVNGETFKNSKEITKKYGISNSMLKTLRVGKKQYKIVELPSRCGIYVDNVYYKNIKECVEDNGYIHRTNFFQTHLKYIGTIDFRKSYQYIKKKLK